jgi:hypothetical protein
MVEGSVPLAARWLLAIEVAYLAVVAVDLAQPKVAVAVVSALLVFVMAWP